MADTSTEHEFQVGDSVLADFDGVTIPGVIEDKQADRLRVRLAEPWTDQSGQSSESVWLTPDRLRAYIGETPDRTLPS